MKPGNIQSSRTDIETFSDAIDDALVQVACCLQEYRQDHDICDTARKDKAGFTEDAFRYQLGQMLAVTEHVRAGGSLDDFDPTEPSPLRERYEECCLQEAPQDSRHLFFLDWDLDCMPISFRTLPQTKRNEVEEEWQACFQ
uniref:Uncharacterized protein n=1 Tax=Mycena chlorophos TaxID=658473 RepID=A0ABQ0LLQ9_MYCCL|nr:predicted protein [Mycena chlorophos]